MKVIRRNVEVVIGIPDDQDIPEDDVIDEVLRVGLDVITKEEFDTLDEHPAWDFLSARVQRTE